MKNSLKRSPSSKCRSALGSLLLSVSLALSSAWAGPMDLGGQFSVSESGAATYSIPVQVPPGTGGIEPKLALSYNSQTGNGLLGMGWSLSGLSAVTRCGRTIAQDGAKGGINFDANDRLCLDGQRLVAIAGAYGADGTEYRTERESFSKIISYGSAGSGPAWFKVWTKAGQILEYGNTADSRIEAQGKTSARVWAINKIGDTTGNYLSFTYLEDSANGDYVPSRIDYTGNVNTNLAPNSSVQFVYEPRPDAVLGFEAGSAISHTRRLVELQVHQGASNLLVQYQLTYGTAGDTNSSAVTAITECVAGDGCKPSIDLNLRAAAASTFVKEAEFQLNGTFPDDATTNLWREGDFNGDGKTDFAYIYGGPGSYLRIWLSNGDGTFSAKPIYDLPGTFPGSPNLWSTGDFDGDGKTDFAYAYTATGSYIRTWLSNGDGTFAAKPIYNLPGTFPSDATTNLWRQGDFNGDGKTDFAYIYGGPGSYLRIWLSNGDGAFSAKPIYNLPGTFPGSPNLWSTGDFDGDGKTDFAYAYTATGSYIRTWLSNGDGTFAAKPIYNLPGTFPSDATTNLWRQGDFNGDGKTDFAYIYGGPGSYLRIWLSNGDGAFSAKPIYNLPGTFPGSPNLWSVGDFYGEGKTGFAYVYTGAGSYIRTWSSNSDGTFSAKPIQYLSGTYPNDAVTSLWREGDFNGDGKSDFGWIFTNVGSAQGASITTIDSTLASPMGAVLGIQSSPGTAHVITYDPATAALHTPDTGGTYPLRDVRAPIYVVASSSVGNGVGGTLTTNYTYGGLKAEVGTGRGLLGFRWIESTQAETGLVTRKEFRQDWPHVGLPSLVKKTLPGAGNNGTLSQATYSYGCLNPALGSACATVIPGTPVPANTRYFPYLSESVESGWDLNGAALPTVTTTNQFDSFGNATQVTVSTGDGYSKTTTNTYSNDTANWHLGRLQRSQVQSVTP